MVDASRLVIFLTFFAGCNYVLSCKINVVGVSPIFTKNFGSKTIVFKAHEETLTLEDGESITAHCRGIVVAASERSDLYYGYNEEVINSGYDTAVFSCDSDFITILGTRYPRVQISCPPYASVSLYESNKKLSKCTKFVNYAIGLKLQEAGDVIKTGVCYDLDNLELKFASYVAYEKNTLVYNKLHVDNQLSLNLNQKLNGLNKYFEFINLNSDLQPLSKAPFNIDEFLFDSLIQDEPLKTQLHDFNYIFNVLWWRQLREENWSFFLDALKERTQTTKYIVNVGTFGNVTLPRAQGNCTSSKNEVVSVGEKGLVIKAPGYIWAHLKSITSGVDEEFVVIGHNSPYKRDPDHSEFCKVDICDEIEWLKNSRFGNLRYLPALGYTFCCRAEDVADKIDYFPFIANEVTTSIPQE